MIGILYLATAPLPGTPDVLLWQAGAYSAKTFGLDWIFGKGGIGPLVMFGGTGFQHWVPWGPMSVYLIKLTGEAFFAYNGVWVTNSAFNAFTNAGPILFTFLTAGLLYYFAGSHLWGRTQARIVTIAYLANPAVWLTSPVLGYGDPPAVFWMLVAIMLGFKRRHALALLALTVAVLFKITALIIAPVVLTIAIRDRKWTAIAWGTALSAAAFFVAWLPWILNGQFPEAIQSIATAYNHHDLSLMAPNIWWLYTVGARGFADAQHGLSQLILQDGNFGRPFSLFWVSSKTLSTLVFGAFSAANVYFLLLRPRQWRGRVFLCAAMQFYGYSVLSTGVHENHAFPTLALLVILFPLPFARRFYIWFSAIYFANLFFWYGLGPDVYLLWSHPERIPVAVTLLACTNMALFGWMTYSLFARQRPTVEEIKLAIEHTDPTPLPASA